MTDSEFDNIEILVNYDTEDFEPYALAMGQLALTWNGLHSSLCLLFWAILEAKRSSMASVIWHSMQNDRAQRDMLKACLDVISDEVIGKYPKLIPEVKWLLLEAEKIEDKRNDFLHSPLILKRTDTGRKVVPHVHFGHRRAKKLDAQTLWRQIVWCRDACKSLMWYSHNITFAMMDDEGILPWPDRPQLPNRGDTKK